MPTKYGIRNREFVIKIFKILKGSNLCNPLPRPHHRPRGVEVREGCPAAEEGGIPAGGRAGAGACWGELAGSGVYVPYVR